MGARVLLTKLPHADPPRDCQSKAGCSAMASHGVLLEEGARRLFKYLCETHADQVAEMYGARGRPIPQPSSPPAPDPFAPPAPPKRAPKIYSLPRDVTPGICSSCGDSIHWIITEANKRMPIDAFGERAGQSHFIGCKHADQHRKPR